MEEINWELLIGISSCVIALCAFSLSIWQSILIRKHNKISFKPHLTTAFHEGHSDGFFKLDLINNGLGPALITNYEVILDNQVIFGKDLEPMYKLVNIIFEGFDYKKELGYVSAGYSMAAKDQYCLISIQFNERWPNRDKIEYLIQRIDIKVEYQSFYGEKYTMSLHD